MEERILLKINGMSCQGCASNVQRALKAVRGVEGVDVHLASKIAIVQVGDDPPTTEQLLAAVKKMGYDAIPTGQ